MNEVHPDRVDWRPGTTPATLTTAGNLAGALVDRARREPFAVAYYLPEEAPGDDRLTVGDLYWRANVAGATLAGAGVGAGERICVCLDTSAALLATLFGAALIGAVPTLVEPPLTAGRKKLWLERVQHIVSVARPAALVCDPMLRDAAEEVFAGTGLTVVCPPYDGGGYVPNPVVDTDPEAMTLIQFSSGTTSAAKGVVLSHRGLLAAADSIGRGGPFHREDVMLSWLPLHHDMGMVGGTLTPFLLDMTAVLVPPLSFAMQPDRWLRLIHRYRATISPAPNFAYRLIASRSSTMDLDGLDLTSWRSAYNGAEVVDAPTLRSFITAMVPYGFRPESLRPCYGMAELGLAATFSPEGTLPRIEKLSRGEMLEHGRAVRADSEWDAHEYVSSGVPVPGVKVRVVDVDGLDLPDGSAGRILVSSDSMMTGYFGLPNRTAEDLREGWLHTGDLGFLLDGELFVTGREKDLIIIAGRNYQPQPFEIAASTVPGVRAGGVAAVGRQDHVRGTEQLVLVVETKLFGDTAAAVDLRAAVERAVADLAGVRPHEVIVVQPGTVPKTPSGKMQRPLLAKMLAMGAVGGAAPEARAG
jgi:acyl-CoA synthetase (AMP-forming)/AMP-acid ligase II